MDGAGGPRASAGRFCGGMAGSVVRLRGEPGRGDGPGLRGLDDGGGEVKIAVVIPPELSMYVPAMYTQPDGTLTVEIFAASKIGNFPTRGEQLEAAGVDAGRVFVFDTGVVK
jgi:hypothetical protein